MTRHEKVVQFIPNQDIRERHMAVAASVRSQPNICKGILEFQSKTESSIQELAESFGVKISRVKMPPHLAGFLYPAKWSTPSGWEIVLNSHLSVNEEKWTIAHELSHWILDKGCQPPEFDDEQILPRIRTSGNDFSKYRVETVAVDLDSKGFVCDVWTEEDIFIEFEEVLESEWRANLLAGYVLLPTPVLRRMVARGETVVSIARKLGVSKNVVFRQILENPRLDKARKKLSIGGNRARH